MTKNNHFLLILSLSLILKSIPNVGCAQEADAQTKKSNSNKSTDSLLIKNVYLISREDTLGDIKVNVLIINSILQIVTRDDISFGLGVQSFDGNNGFLMGNVVIGQSPSFVILDENPREHFDVFLNTSKHITFAMEKGVIVVNELKNEPLSSQQERQRRLTWRAYQPPPMAVPINYYNSRKWNKFNTKIISGLFNGILALDRLRWTSQDANSKQQVGPLEENSIGAVRAIRFGLVGTLNFKTPWVYTIFYTNNTFDRGYDPPTDNSLRLYDLRIDIPIAKWVNMSVGKQKEPISMDRLTTLVFLPMQERQAAADAFLPARNYGVLFNGTAFKSRGTWAAGIFKNTFDSDTSFSATPTQITGRVSGLPILSKDESNLLHLGLGIRYSSANLPLVGRADAEFFAAPAFIKTENIQANYLLTYVIEAYWLKGPFLLGTEYIGNRVNSSGTGKLSPGGWNITWSWIVTGEMRKYRKRSGIFDPVPVSRPVGQGGWGALELSTRYSSINFSDESLTGGTMNTYSIGANWWLNARAEFCADYRFIQLDRFDIRGYSSGLNFRLMLILD
jgi:phosphate-selective porin OprO/OprP